MTHDDRRAFGLLMLKLADVYDKPVSEVVLETHWEALQDYELSVLEAAAREWLRTSKWFPKPAELREIASQLRGEARRLALTTSQPQLVERMLTAEEAKAFMDALRAMAGLAEPVAEIPRKGAEALQEDLRRLEALGARDMTEDKRKALEAFQRYREAS